MTLSSIVRMSTTNDVRAFRVCISKHTPHTRKIVRICKSMLPIFFFFFFLFFLFLFLFVNGNDVVVVGSGGNSSGDDDDDDVFNPIR